MGNLARYIIRASFSQERKTGDLLVQKDLANTLQMIAKNGPNYYYRGPIAKAVADIVKARGGPMEASDIQTYEVKWRHPATRGPSSPAASTQLPWALPSSCWPARADTRPTS